jgi:hypothetical protein
MTMINKKMILLYVPLFAALMLTLPAEETGKPVALVGSSYGVHEIKLLINNAIVVSEEETYIYKNCGADVPVSELNKYSLLIIATSVDKALTDGEMEKLKGWVLSGGNLMLIQGAPAALCGGTDGLQKKKLLSWAGIQSVKSLNTAVPCKVTHAESALLNGVELAKGGDGKLGWSENVNYIAIVNSPMEPIIGDPSSCFIGIAKVGKGTVSYFGEELFRMQKNKPESAKKYLEMMRNAIRMANPLHQKEMGTSMLGKGEWGDTEILFWNREWSRGEQYGPRFTPPLPDKKELVKNLSAEMAVDEYETLQLNLTPLKNIGTVSFNIESKGIPMQNLEFMVQEKPNPIPWPKNPEIAQEFPYWMIAPEYLAGKSKDSFALPKIGETKVTWLRVNSHGLKPGSYNVFLNFKVPGGKTVQIPVNVKVYSVILPRKRLIKLAAAGQVYGDANNPTPALRFAKNLETHGIEWSLVNIFRLGNFKIQGTEELFTAQYVQAHKKDFEEGCFPELDMTALDPWMEQAIGHGLTNFYASPKMHDLEKLGFKKEHFDKINEWFIGQASRYMKEKGIRMFVATSGDELSLEELKKTWEPWARQLVKSGWNCSSTFSCGVDVEYFNQISPLIKLWTFNQAYVQTFIEKVRQGEIKIRKDAVIGTYGAGEGRGSEFRKPLGKSRYLGWISWLNGVQNCAVNPYFKSWIYYCDYGTRGEAGGLGGERFVSYIDQDNLSVPLADCPFWEGVREGMEEGNLCAILSWYLTRLESAGGTATAKAKAVRQKLEQIINSSDTAVIKWNSAIRYKYPVKEIEESSPVPNYKKAKTEILELLVSLKDDASKFIRPSLYWNDIELVRDGNAVAAVYYDKIKPESLLQEAKELSGIDLPAFQSATELNNKYRTAIIVGNLSQNRLSKKVLEENKSRDADKNYPGTGSYYIRELKDSGKNILIIAGPEDAGTEKGIKMFNQFLYSEGNWLIMDTVKK